MFYTILSLYTNQHETKMIEMLAQANNVSFERMSKSYYDMQHILSCVSRKQK